MRTSSIAPTALADFLAAVRSTLHVRGSTHRFYRYPGRFSPLFARKAIAAFSRAGDTVLDPFMGGGTSAVEALLLRRRFLGIDVNPLSIFITRVKTTPLSRSEAGGLLRWQSHLTHTVDLSRGARRSESWVPYQHHVPWWLRKTIEQALDSVEVLPTANQQRFARCSLLKTAQWALDCRRRLPSKDEFLAAFETHFSEMIRGSVEFSDGVRSVFGSTKKAFSHRRLLLRPAHGLDQDKRIPMDWKPIDLVVTSPPYMGVHVLYHRWQVMSRRETSAPYWIAGLEDGHAASFYTFGPRDQKGWSGYLLSLGRAFSSISALMRPGGYVVQLVGFSSPDEQIDAYLDVLASAGLQEASLAMGDNASGRLWRKVPNRRWYAGISNEASGSKEVLLIHRKVDNS